MEAEGPGRLDRLQFFPLLRSTLPTLMNDILYKNSDDLAFEQVIEAATYRRFPAITVFVAVPWTPALLSRL